MKPLLCARLLLAAAVVGTAACAEARGRRAHKRDAVPFDEELYPEPKYFKEAFGHAHYDARFMMGEPLDEAPHRDAIRILVQTYLATFRELGVETWLMHGTLLGWWWGGKVMPWDFDADVQVSEGDIYYLAAYHNMTVYHYKYGGMETEQAFLLDVNPHFRHREPDDALNFIDARWIDMATGLFIDITAARYNLEHPADSGILQDKNGHEFRDTYVFPLRQTTFEGVPAKVPFRSREMLESEYGEGAVIKTEFERHTFDTKKKQWVLTETAAA